ncbi:MAG TPA: hypothetical protein VLY23_15025 [Candidatus Acidoferrum sp.]|nr:hypothetical protein [Candidatus Acidoferrum sp.]
MNRANIFRILSSGRSSALAALLVFGLLFAATSAKAGCADPYKPGAAPSMPFLGHQEGNPSDEPATIVGLWHLIYTADDGSKFLESFKTWHGDGTEFENAFVPPSGNNICYGVWKDLGHGSVKLHHIGLMFGPDGTPSNTFTIDEIDRVARNGKTYEGTFDFKLFDTSGTMVAEVKGTTAGTRITVD